MFATIAFSRRISLIALVAGGLATRNLFAQSVQPGTRLRVVSTVNGARPIVGKFVRKTEDTLWLSRNNHESAMPILLNEHTRVDQSVGHSDKPVRGLVGGIIGLALGSFIASGFTPKGCSPECGTETSEVVSVLAVPFVFIPLGAYVGVRTARERWKPVAVTTRFDNRAQALGLSAKFAF